ncbi:MAG: polysaccharide pyruvyl transferase family protein [Syntrophaceae bacterium]|nr:polysaccharide pyruvyl transferase family protein [Syntrophaceae bacterium]
MKIFNRIVLNHNINHREKKMALISGYYGMDNTGDDCLLAVASWGTRTFIKPHKLLASAVKVPSIVNCKLATPILRYKQFLPGQHRLTECITALGVKTIVFGGGSIFHTARDIKHKMELLKLSGRGPHYAIGVSLGPFRDKASEVCCEELLKRLSFVGLRDQESVDIAQSMSKNIYYKKTFDLAPLLPRSCNTAIEPFLQSSRERKGIGIALCDYERYTGGDRANEMARRKVIINVIKKISKEIMDEVVFIDFNGHRYFGDASIHRDIEQEISHDVKVRHIPYLADPLQTLKEIGNLRLLLAMRLHGAVFGFITNTPTMMITYHPKCRGWASQIGLAERYMIDSTALDVDYLRDLILEISDGHYNYPRLSYPEAEKLSMLNFSFA